MVETNTGKCLLFIEYQQRAKEGVVKPLTCKHHEDTLLVPAIRDNEVLIHCARRSCDYHQLLSNELYDILQRNLAGYENPVSMR